jgi:hypothetical protein
VDSRLSLRDVNDLYQILTAEQRQELLECLLVASAKGGDEMLRVLQELVLCRATEELIEPNK